MTYGEIGQHATHVRGIPLETVLEEMGAARDREDKAKWRTERGVISVNGTRFMDWGCTRGGGGAIDLVMHIRGIGFKDAVAWLWERFSGSGGLAELPQPAPRRVEFRLPPPCPALHARVVSYLERARTLPRALIDELFAGGTVYADARGNAVFVLLGKKKTPVGAELRGTTHIQWRGMAAGTRKDDGYFSAPAAGGAASAVMLCESAIDAMSCRVLYPDRLCISTSGARPDPGWLAELVRDDYDIYCGFDADRTGDDMAAAMIGRYPKVRRLRPALHDWNDVLTSRAAHIGLYQGHGLTELARFR
jgi:hypothetical protein